MRQRAGRAASVIATVLVAVGVAACGSDAEQSDVQSAGSGGYAPLDTDGSDSAASRVRVEPRPLPERLARLSESFTKHAEVFGVDVLATAATPDESITHAASVLAEYLDNDTDGVPDDRAVVAAMRANAALLIMGADEGELEQLDVYESLDGLGAQDLYADETNPADGFDATLEEVHHLIATRGWAEAYPDQLRPEKGSRLAQAMDQARGGHFDQIPASYPDRAWYHYDDTTCNYSCMATEYIYWAHTSLLGAQAERCDEISAEWEPCTAEELRSTDASIAGLLNDPELGLPTRLPDGTYER